MLASETTNRPAYCAHDPEVTLAHDLTGKCNSAVTFAGHHPKGRQDPTGGSSADRHRMRSRSVPDAASGKPSRSPDLNCSPTPQVQHQDSVSTQQALLSKTRSRSVVDGSAAPRSTSADAAMTKADPKEPNSAHDVKSEDTGQPDSCDPVMATHEDDGQAAADFTEAPNAVLGRQPRTEDTAQMEQHAAKLRFHPIATAKRRHGPNQGEVLHEYLHQLPGIPRLRPDRATDCGQDRSVSMSEAEEENSDGEDRHGHKRQHFQGVHRPLWSAWCDAYADLPDLDGDNDQARSAAGCCWCRHE